jgi:signal transduction histidine kinase
VAAAKGIRLETEIEDAVQVFGDSSWIERILLNLMDNAIKYTPSDGQVRFVLHREDARACIGIHDTGVGISRESLPHIFERFYRADPARSKEVEGAGLGLSLVQWAVERHNGTISVESSPHFGTSFEIRLPLHIKNI